jgi:hypothetical protein
MKLRDYQLEISDAVFDYLFTKEGNPVVASPGGTGKSLTMNHIIKRLVTEWPTTPAPSPPAWSTLANLMRPCSTMTACSNRGLWPAGAAATARRIRRWTARSMSL